METYIDLIMKELNVFDGFVKNGCCVGLLIKINKNKKSE